MLGTLQFATQSNYSDATDVGTLRSRKKGYVVKPVTDENRSGNPETVLLEIEARALCLTLDTNFLADTEYYFQVYCPAEARAFRLGLRSYQVDYDGLINRNGIEYHEVRVSFNDAADSYSTYAVGVSIPPP